MEEEKVEEDITSFKELRDKHSDVSQDNLFRMVLVCKNCGHKDLLVNFLRKIGKSNSYEEYKKYVPKPNPHINPYNPSPGGGRIPPLKRYTIKGSNKIMIIDEANKLFNLQCLKMNIVVDSEYEEFFYCPQCGSSLVSLCSEYAKNNIVRVL